MKNVLVTGASSGIGHSLSSLLIKKGYKVWGVARRKKLLELLNKELKNKNFFYTAGDISQESFWEQQIKKMKKNKFTPDIVVFNAAMNENDLKDGMDLDKLKQMMEVNFFSILKGVKLIMENYKNKLHFIAISSTSSVKGNYIEGIGYAASKGALSIAFESLFQKYENSKAFFTTVYFGPVTTDMSRFIKPTPMTLTKEKAAMGIIKAIENKRPFYYYPKAAFVVLSIMRLLPKQTFFWLWKNLQKSYTKNN